MSWVIRGYSGHDQVESELAVDALLRTFFQRLLRLEVGDSVFDLFPLDSTQLETLRSVFGFPPPQTSVDYFLEFDA